MQTLYDIHSLPLSSSHSLREAESFLKTCGISLEPSLSYMAVMRDNDFNIVAAGGLERDIIKCVAVADSHRGENLGVAMVSHLMNRALYDGASDIKVFTKPENLQLFRSMGFSDIGISSKAVMMESDRHALKRYCDLLAETASAVAAGKRSGVIVMNCNPLTNGHMYLIRQAAARTDHLFIIPLSDNPATLFSHARRREMLARATADMPQVTILPDSPSCISAATFPSYFLKRKSDASLAHINLDLDIFIRHIAPALGVAARFAGSEPLDPLTALYNERMGELLPEAGIEFIEIPRLADDCYGHAVSASRVRAHIAALEGIQALRLTPEASHPAILAALAAEALTRELILTPKPGLVDLDNNGAHTDMNPELMRLSIASLRESLCDMASLAASGASTEELHRAGAVAEQKMLADTRGINTHKGALFAFALVISAFMRLKRPEKNVSLSSLQNEIISIATGLPAPEATAGARLRRLSGIRGAVETAREGYALLFSKWLPAHLSGMTPLRLLLEIITDIDDSNLYHRGGAEGADFARRQALRLLNECDDLQLPHEVARMDRLLTERNLSPGGSADMLALTFFIGAIADPRENPDI